MLDTLLGEEFPEGMQLYFERHDGGATCDDFVERWRMPRTSTVAFPSLVQPDPARWW